MEIKEILEKLGISRMVTNQDRTYYKTWKQDWNLSSELIALGVEMSAGKFQPLQYLNKLLSNWHTSGVKTIDEAKNCVIPEKAPNKKEDIIKGKSYEKEELDALFDSLEEIEL